MPKLLLNVGFRLLAALAVVVMLQPGVSPSHAAGPPSKACERACRDADSLCRSGCKDDCRDNFEDPEDVDRCIGGCTKICKPIKKACILECREPATEEEP